MNALLQKLRDGWASRSLAVGAASTVLDLGVGGLVLLFDDGATRVASMTGIGAAAVFAFFANRYFAFRDTQPDLARPAIRYALLMMVATLIHGQFVVWLRDGHEVPYALAKMGADFAVFTVGQLVVLRYIVFPKKVLPATTEAPLPPGAP